MRPSYATARRFQQLVADLLQLPLGSGDAEVGKALLAEGAHFLAWYDTRLRVIAESKQQARCLERNQRAARRVNLHH